MRTVFALTVAVLAFSAGPALSEVEFSGGDLRAEARVVMDDCPFPVVLVGEQTNVLSPIDLILPSEQSAVGAVDQSGCTASAETVVRFDPATLTLSATAALNIERAIGPPGAAAFPQAVIRFVAHTSTSLSFQIVTDFNLSPSGFTRAILRVWDDSDTLVLVTIITESTITDASFNVVAGRQYRIEFQANLTEHEIGPRAATVGWSLNGADGPDSDADGIIDPLDNCPDDFNDDQADFDLDLIGDVCDPFPDDRDNEQAQCEDDLAECEAVPAFLDSDGDGEDDSTDACPDTLPGRPVDGNGCTQAQFCSTIDTSTKAGERICKSSDWRNDEPVTKPKDCAVLKGTATLPAACRSLFEPAPFP